MNRKDAMSTAVVVAILAAEYLFLRTWTGSRCASTCTNRMKYGFSSKKVLTCPLVLPPAAGNRHNFRVANEQVYEYDQLVAVKFDELSERKASADDKELVDLVKEIFDLPSGKSGTKLSHTARWTPQSIFVKNYFSNKRNGKFIDVGSYDGEVASNSVALEKYLNWTGLLIEPDPNYYTIMMGKNRQVYSINGCLSPKNYFSKMTFKDSDKYFGGQFGKLVEDSQPGRKVPCYPFETLMLALGWTEVDYFSLDVQGLELEILKTVPWDKIKIKVVSVEFGAGKATKDDYINFMKSKGYNFKEELKSNDEKMHVYVNDLMFVKE